MYLYWCKQYAVSLVQWSAHMFNPETGRPSARHFGWSCHGGWSSELGVKDQNIGMAQIPLRMEACIIVSGVLKTRALVYTTWSPHSVCLWWAELLLSIWQWAVYTFLTVGSRLYIHSWQSTFGVGLAKGFCFWDDTTMKDSLTTE